ncbi:MAG: LPS-assembly protein LptD [Granulosicoccus sp.]
MLFVLSACRVAEAALCPAPAFVYTPEAFASQPGAPVTAEADNLESNDGVVTLEGNTIIEYLGRKLTAQNALYNQNTGELSVEGPLSFLGAGVQLESNDAFIDIDDDIFTAGQSEYQLDLSGKRATGTASAMEGLPNGDFTLTEATYSTCPPGDRSWYVKADSLQLYPSEGVGTARNLRLVFKGVPLLAVPAFSFPISDMRKTGFLAPILAQSDRTGIELHLPWYWNIRPNADATFTPRLMTRRGAQLQSELRYRSRQGMWTLNHEYLRDRAKDNDTRYFTNLRHNGRFNTEFSSEIVARRVSDKDYLEDLGDSLQVASITHLEQRADLMFEKGRVSGLGRLQGFQTVDETIAQEDRPHARLPQVKIQANSGRLPFGLRADVVSEFVYFDKDDAVTGVRVDMQPRLTMPVVRDAWFIRPSASHRFTYYSLNNTEENAEPDTRLRKTSSRNLNSLSLDSGLFFDRLLDDRGSIQTLEPRLFYLRVPYTEQSDIPVFDSSAFDFNISQLFRDNRFSGADRVADADQLSMALTTRTIDGQDGRDVFRASIGQIRYFEDRRVTLPPQDTIETRDTSDFVGEVYTTLNQNWVGKGSIQWNPDETSTVRSSLALGYRPGPDHIANVAHRVVRSEVSQLRTEQIDLSALWKFSDSWRIAGRWNYSLDADQSIESLLALEYESCCWAMRFAARRYIADNGDDHDFRGYFQLVLKGLAPLGQNYGALLESAVTGYRDTID